MISQSRYIKIVSGVGAGAAVAQRQLILRLITQNNLLPPGVIGEFSTADAVASFFTAQSEEYRRALAYFSFISKNIKSPGKISFARWVSAAIAPMVVGDTVAKTLGMFTSVTAGTLSILSGGVPVAIAAINLSTATSLTQVATMLQTALRASSDPQLATGSTVTWNPSINQFVLSGATTGSGTLAVSPTGTNADLSQLLGWATSGTVLVAGQAADTPAQAVAKSAGISNNFGSFAFTTPATPLANEDIAAIAEWNHGQNNMYLYAVPISQARLAALYALVKGFSGCSLNLLSTVQPNDFIEQSPCEILAATDYTAINSTQNFMWYQFPNRNVTVSDDATADAVDLNRGNYIGVTQQAGQSLAFYQRGVLCGGAQAAVDTNTYCNEMWLKGAIISTLMSLFLSIARVPANETGAAMLLAVMQSVINTAKLNGTISPGKEISIIQQQYITQVTGDELAWRQVANIGYWITIDFKSMVTTDGRTEWYASYTLIYSKDDAIRTVQGSDILI